MQDPGKIVRQGSLENQGLVRPGVMEGKEPGMEQLPVDLSQDLLQTLVFQ